MITISKPKCFPYTNFPFIISLFHFSSSSSSLSHSFLLFSFSQKLLHPLCADQPQLYRSLHFNQQGLCGPLTKQWLPQVSCISPRYRALYFIQVEFDSMDLSNGITFPPPPIGHRPPTFLHFSRRELSSLDLSNGLHPHSHSHFQTNICFFLSFCNHQPATLRNWSRGTP